jgi:hypothetical protein
MKKILLLTAVLLGAVSASQAGGLHLSIGLPLPPLPPLPGIHITAPAPVVYAPPVCPPAYSYSYGPAYCPPAVVIRPPVVSFGYGYPYYGRYYGGGYYRGGGYYHGGYRGGYYHHGRW